MEQEKPSKEENRPKNETLPIAKIFFTQDCGLNYHTIFSLVWFKYENILVALFKIFGSCKPYFRINGKSFTKFNQVANWQESTKIDS